MANNTFTDVSELDVSAFKSNLQTFLSGQAIFKDYNFDGSNLSALLDVLAYNTFNNAFYMNMQFSETFLDSATLKESVVSRAKELNYVPRSRVSATASVQFSVQTSNAALSTITVPKGYYFTSSGADGKGYLFSPNESTVLRNEGGSFSTNLTIYEGRWVTEYFVANSTSNTSTNFVLSSANVDISSVYVTVQNSQTDTTTSIFSRAYNLFGLDETSEVYFIEGYSANNYSVVFGNGETGVALQNQNVVIVSYRESNGQGGNGFTRFSPAATIVDDDGNVFTNFIVNTLVAASGGAEREGLNSIKFNAPRSFASQDRAITKNDYTVLLKNNFPTIQAISVFGGEELAQKQYGKVIIATKPVDGTVTPTTIKEQMATFLTDRMSLTVAPIFVDPDYFYVEIETVVSYDPSVTSKTTSDIETLVRAAINSYNSTYLYDFNADFRYSKMVAQIDNADTSIVSDDTTCRMVRRLTPIEDYAYSDTINFFNPFYQDTSSYSRPIANRAVIESDYFTYVDVNGNSYNCKLRDDGLGNLQIISDYPNIISTVGEINYATGTVTITNLIVSSYSGHINLYATLATKDFTIGANQILNIDQADVTVSVIKASS